MESKIEFLCITSRLIRSIVKEATITDDIVPINNPNIEEIEISILKTTNNDIEKPNEAMIANADISPGILYQTDTIIATNNKITPDAKNTEL